MKQISLLVQVKKEVRIAMDLELLEKAKLLKGQR
jgi:hypothetical protein